MMGIAARLHNWLWDRLQIRWRMADFMDGYRDTCWCRLVGWAGRATGEEGWLDVWDLRGTAGRCARAGETAYCGKCAVTGVHAERGGRVRAWSDISYSAF